MSNIELFGIPLTSGDTTSKLRELLSKVKAIIFTLDGVLTDGQLYFSESGQEIQSFHARDGLAIKEALKNNIQIGAISERSSQSAQKYLESLGVEHIKFGVQDKLKAYDEIVSAMDVSDEQCLYIGDEITDIPVLKKAGVSSTPINGIEFLRNRVYYVSGYDGGKGCIRELVEMVLTLQGHWPYYDD